MIHLLKGSLFDTSAEALINTINTVGVMGKGIALQFKERFPTNYELYRQAFEQGHLKPGKMLLTETGLLHSPRYIINFPTKQHWREKSKLWYIEEGMKDLVELIRTYQISSIAMPPLGCGNGGLKWEDVRPIIESHLALVEGVTVYLFEPSNAAYQKARKREGRIPRLTTTRAMILYCLHRYLEKGYQITLLEVQKLVYFLQRLGITFQGLTFNRGIYGPYAQKLQHAIHDLDGHYLEGMKYGDAKPHDPIHLKTEHLPAIQAFIEANFSDKEQEALRQIDQLIEGFETPLGLEMLATLDFLIQEEPSLRHDLSALTAQAYAWNKRKAEVMKPQYLKVTHSRLQAMEQVLYAG